MAKRMAEMQEKLIQPRPGFEQPASPHQPGAEVAGSNAPAQNQNYTPYGASGELITLVREAAAMPPPMSKMKQDAAIKAQPHILAQGFYIQSATLDSHLRTTGRIDIPTLTKAVTLPNEVVSDKFLPYSSISLTDIAGNEMPFMPPMLKHGLVVLSNQRLLFLSAYPVSHGAAHDASTAINLYDSMQAVRDKYEVSYFVGDLNWYTSRPLDSVKSVELETKLGTRGSSFLLHRILCCCFACCGDRLWCHSCAPSCCCGVCGYDDFYSSDPSQNTITKMPYGCITLWVIDVFGVKTKMAITLAPTVTWEEATRFVADLQRVCPAFQSP